MKAYVDCVGCEQRQLDAQRVINYLTVNGLEITSQPNNCDYAILVTCAVDQLNEDESIKRLEGLEDKVSSKSKIIVGGCLPSISPERLSKRVLGTFSPRTMESLDSLLGIAVKIPMDGIPDPNTSLFDDVTSHGKLSPGEEYKQAKNGYKLRIDHGCLMKCSYCSIQLATGVLKSEDPDKLVDKFRNAVTDGKKTVMLVGGDTGAYGYDMGMRFYNLLERFLEIDGDYQIFIHDFNLNWLAKDLPHYLDVFSISEDTQKIRAANFPIQSGSDRILKLMKRPYTKDICINALTSVRRVDPSMAQGTHIIVGFPDESKKDFAETLGLLHSVTFDFVSCFAYSENKRTASAKIENKIPQEVIDERLEILKREFGDEVRIYR